MQLVDRDGKFHRGLGKTISRCLVVRDVLERGVSGSFLKEVIALDSVALGLSML